MKKRNLALCVIFSIITFGIYGIYWFIKINNDANELANPPKKTSGGVAFLLTLITCGIYGIYWAYKMGKQLDSALMQRGMPAKNGAVLYLILSVIGSVSYTHLSAETAHLWRTAQHLPCVPMQAILRSTVLRFTPVDPIFLHMDL